MGLLCSGQGNLLPWHLSGEPGPPCLCPGLGGDGRPDFAERKTCNFLTQYVECQTKGGLGRGSMATRMDAEMELQLKIKLNDMEAQNWDIEKCPAVRTVLERLEKEDSETSTNTNSGAVTQAAVALPSLLATLYLATP